MQLKKLSKSIGGFLGNPQILVAFLLAYMVLYRLHFVGDILAPLRTVFVAWAVLLGIYLLWKQRDFYRVPGIWLAPVVAGSGLITLALNQDHLPATQLGSLVMMVVAFAIAYPTGFQIARSDNPSKHLANICIPALVLIFVSSVIALVMALMGFSYVDNSYKPPLRVGIVLVTYSETRVASLLYGIAKDPNFAVFYLVFAIIVSVWMWLYRDVIWPGQPKYTFLKIAVWVSVPLHTVVLVLGGSRGALVSALAAGIFYTVAVYFRHRRRHGVRSSLLRGLAHLAVYLVLVTVAVAGVNMASIGYYSLPMMQKKTVSEYSSEALHNKPKLHKECQEIKKNKTELCDTKTKKTVSVGKGSPSDSSRKYIWTEGLQLWQQQPVFGFGSGPLKYNAEKYDIGGHDGHMMLKTGRVLHNSYLELLVRYGVAGFLAFLAFAVRFFVFAAGKFRRRGLDYEDVLFILLWAFYMCGFFFVTGLFTRFTFYYLVLLIIMGFVAGKRKRVCGTEKVAS